MTVNTATQEQFENVAGRFTDTDLSRIDFADIEVGRGAVSGDVVIPTDRSWLEPTVVRVLENQAETLSGLKPDGSPRICTSYVLVSPAVEVGDEVVSLTFIGGRGKVSEVIGDSVLYEGGGGNLSTNYWLKVRSDRRKTVKEVSGDQALLQRAEAAEKALADLWDSLGQEAEERGWCSEYEEFARKHGHEGRRATHRVTVEVTTEVDVLIEAPLGTDFSSEYTEELEGLAEEALNVNVNSVRVIDSDLA